ncbi:MAG: hypothetical protein COA45_11520 [Zetaproteobacteria bacterium]|nr:MAG: hypothetical protein COA45_11520 [Zetaproteobacteria bacterium]
MSTAITGNYIYKRGLLYHFKKRIPKEYGELFPGTHIRSPLRTDSELIAIDRAKEFTAMLEDYYEDIALNGEDLNQDRFKKYVKRLSMCSFKWRPYKEIISEISDTEFSNRLSTLENANTDYLQEALMGTLKQPKIVISKSLKALERRDQITLVKKSKDELRKWRNPRLRAISNFSIAMGEDKVIKTITRYDILTFRDWWFTKIQDEELKRGTANKDFTNLKRLILISSDDHILNMEVEQMFVEIRFKAGDEMIRRPFPTEFIQNTLLQHDYVGLSPECKWLIFAMADTGARIKELAGLDAKNGEIVLEGDTPHIKIQENQYRELKTKPSRRDIPLVGAALLAFQQLAEINKDIGGGFKQYLGKSDTLSANTNKYMKTHNLRPEKDITLYSLRHSFEDRLQSQEPPDKVQAYIFGHAFERQRYGDGPTLEQKKKWMDKIAFKV